VEFRGILFRRNRAVGNVWERASFRAFGRMHFTGGIDVSEFVMRTIVIAHSRVCHEGKKQFTRM
jgi:hypothetical protein